MSILTQKPFNLVKGDDIFVRARASNEQGVGKWSSENTTVSKVITPPQPTETLTLANKT